MKLHFVNKAHLNSDIWRFDFEKPSGYSYIAGQFIELTISDEHPDDRGTKRWFTLSSSPTEDMISITTRLVEKHSTFKGDLSALKAGDVVETGAPEGTFTLPDVGKIAWIAGGIGVTPFRSQIKYLLDTKHERDIVLIHGNRTPDDIAYCELFKQAENELSSFRYVPVVGDTGGVEWNGKVGTLDDALLLDVLEDLRDRAVFVSGPEPMVEAFKPRLMKLGVEEDSIHQDWFPGYIDEFTSPPAQSSK